MAQEMDKWDKLADKMFPCNCTPFKDGSHWHDCQSQYAEDVAYLLWKTDRDARLEGYSDFSIETVKPPRTLKIG